MWSRVGRVLEIPDVNKEEALQYLKHWKIDDETAAQICEHFGGRVIHLQQVAEGMTQGKRSLSGK